MPGEFPDWEKRVIEEAMLRLLIAAFNPQERVSLRGIAEPNFEDLTRRRRPGSFDMQMANAPLRSLVSGLNQGNVFNHLAPGRSPAEQGWNPTGPGASTAGPRLRLKGSRRHSRA